MPTRQPQKQTWKGHRLGITGRAAQWRRVRGEMRLVMPAWRAATLTARWTVSGQMGREGSFLLGNNKPTG